MEFLQLADTHINEFGTRNYGFGDLKERRTGEIVDNLHQALEYATNNDIKYIVHSGDLCHTSSPPKEYMQLVYDFVRELQRRDITMILALGNHDKPTYKHSRHALYGLEDVNVPNIHISSTPELLSFPDFEVFNLPWMWNKRDQEKYQLENIIPNLDIHNQLVLNAHVSIEGMFDNETDFTINPKHLDEFQHAALGHIHQPQWVTNNSYYPGSGTILSWGEASQNPHGFLHYTDNNISIIPFENCRVHLDIQPSQIPYLSGDLSETLIRVTGTRANFDKHDLSKLYSCFHVTKVLHDPERRRPFRSFISSEDMTKREIFSEYLKITKEGNTDNDELLDLFDEVMEGLC